MMQCSVSLINMMQGATWCTHLCVLGPAGAGARGLPVKSSAKMTEVYDRGQTWVNQVVSTCSS